jgi:crossover junction endodeoxyribonuclease RuvC
MTTILGIDPGKSGALAVIHPERRAVKSYRFDSLSEQDIYSLILGYSLDGCRAFLEKVHAMPGQGVTSMFTFGTGYGFLRGVLTAIGIPFEDVPPQTWQKKLGLGGKYDSKPDRKKAHRAHAQQLFPQLKITLDDADALLIAEYGYRVTNGR